MRKNNRLFIIFMILFTLVIVGSSPVSSFSMESGFDFDDVTEETANKRIELLDLKILTELPVIERSFVSFDVNKSGDVLVCFDEMRERNYIIVYDSFAEFKYGFSFVGSGMYAAEWIGENIAIYGVRSQIAVIIDQTGNFLEVKAIQRGNENDQHWNEVVSNEKVFDNITYKAEALIPGGVFVRLVKTSYDGQEQVIFENTVGITFFYVVVIAVVCIVLAVFAAFWIVLIKIIIKEMRKTNNKTNI